MGKRIFLKLSKIPKIRPMAAQTMLSYRSEKISRQIDYNFLGVETLECVKHIANLKLLSLQAGCRLAHYFRDILSFISMYGFNRLQLRITLLYH